MPKRRDLFALPLFAAGAAKGATLPNVSIDPMKAKLTKEKFGDLRIYFEGSTDQIKSMTAGSLLLKAGMSPHPPHRHDEEEFMVITQGSGEVSIEGAVTKVASGSMLYCAGNKLHGIVNTGKSPLLFYFYKWMV